MATSTPSRRKKLSSEKKLALTLFLLVFVMIAGYCLIILPQAWAYVRKIQTIPAATVEYVFITRMQRVENRMIEETYSLPAAQIPAFLKLVAEAESSWPDHPNFDHKYYIQIRTTTSAEVLDFVILPTKNIGTLININSNGIDGWDYGTLRNDALKPILDAIPFKAY